jgi:hypothetical protein
MHYQSNNEVAIFATRVQIRPCCQSAIQRVDRPLRHLAAYGSTNKYIPVKNCKASGITATRPNPLVYFFCAMAMPLTITAAVKATDSQRWVCRIHLLQFNVEPPFEDEPEKDRPYLSIRPASGIVAAGTARSSVCNRRVHSKQLSRCYAN